MKILNEKTKYNIVYYFIIKVLSKGTVICQNTLVRNFIHVLSTQGPWKISGNRVHS